MKQKIKCRRDWMQNEGIFHYHIKIFHEKLYSYDQI